MQRDDVIRLAREADQGSAGSECELFGGGIVSVSTLERFAQLVAAQAAAEEREACAKYIERQKVMVLYPLQIRTADQVAQGQKQMCKFLATAIRARGNT